jgi:polar amino acid transport system substrate-binding protein
MKKFVIIIMAFYLGIGLAFAQEITIVTENYPPFQYEENREVKGLNTEIVNAILKELNMEVRIGMYPWARAYKMALENKNTLIYAISRTQKRENLFKWVGPTAPVKYCLFALKERDDVKVTTLEDAKKYAIGTVKTDVIEQYLSEKGFRNIKPNSSYEANMKMLLTERIELWALVEFTAYDLMRKNNVNPTIVKKTYCMDEISRVGSYIAFSKDTPDEIVEKFKKAYYKIKNDGISLLSH